MTSRKTDAEEFEEADEAFTKAMRAYSEASDVLWHATRRRGEAWRKLRDRAQAGNGAKTANQD